MFVLSRTAYDALFPQEPFPPRHLAYVEWFTDFTNQPDAIHGLYKIQREVQDGTRLASIIPVKSIRRTVQLFPAFGPVVPREWTSSNVLDLSPSFYVDRYLDRHSFVTVQ